MFLGFIIIFDFPEGSTVDKCPWFFCMYLGDLIKLKNCLATSLLLYHVSLLFTGVIPAICNIVLVALFKTLHEFHLASLYLILFQF